MLITAKLYESGRVALSKPVLNALGVTEGDLIEIRVNGYITTVPIRSINRAAIPARIRDAIGLEPGDLVQIDIGLPDSLRESSGR